MPDHETDGSNQLLGIGMVLASAVAFSLSGVLTKAIESDTWTVACWRGLFGAVLIVAYVFWQNRTNSTPTGLRLGWRGWLLAGVGSLASLAFIAAFKMTYVANVAIIYATVPFAAAFLEWVLLRQKVRRPTMVAATISVAGVLVMVGAGVGSVNLLGCSCECRKGSLYQHSCVAKRVLFATIGDMNNEIEMRQAVSEDAEAIRKLTREAYAKWVPLIGREPLPMSADYQEAIQKHRFDLLFIDGTLAALIETISHDDHLLIENVAVSSAFQGRGLGKKLLAHTEQLAASLGYAEIKLYTNKLFTENLTFYKRLGYRVEQEEDFMGGVCVHMNKTV